jgi:phage-related protein
MEDAYESYDQPYTLFIGDGKENCIEDILEDVAQKLYKTGYQVLMDDYDTDHFRLAYFKDSFDVENRYTRAGKFEVVFHCRPERFLISGNTEVAVSSGNSIFNPTGFNAKPLIHITGSGSGTLTVNGTTMSFTNIADYLNIDCERMDVYRLPAENKNSLMTGEFPVLKSGNNLVSFTGGIATVTITPKWWTI